MGFKELKDYTHKLGIAHIVKNNPKFENIDDEKLERFKKMSLKLELYEALVVIQKEIDIRCKII